MITPYIYFSSQQFSHDWADLSAVQIVEAAAKLHESLKTAVNYPWDNTHFVLETSSGHAGLNLLFEPGINAGSIACWSSRTRCVVGDLDIGEPGTLTRTTLVETLSDWAEKAAQGKALCCECHKWVDAFKHFDYAGSVCMHCFNPKKHCRPDTSGS